MEIIAHNPTDGAYPTGPDYIHALEVRAPSRFLYISGTMGLDPAGVPGEDLDAQLVLVWNNIRTILASAGMSVDNVVRQTSYLRDAAYADKNAAARVAALNGRVIPTTAIVVQTLDPKWLIELEIIAAA